MSRLGQMCSYGSQVAASQANSQRGPSINDAGYGTTGVDPQSDTPGAQRLQHIEQRLEEISALLQERIPQKSVSVRHSPHYVPSYTEDATQPGSRNSLRGQQDHGHQTRSILSPTLMSSEVEVYLRVFHEQPYCVFTKTWLLSNTHTLPPEIQYPLVALTQQYLINAPSTPGSNRSPRFSYAEQAWRTLSEIHQEGRTSISFLQGTFLLAQLDFASGNAQRGCMSVGLGMRVIQSYGLNHGRNLSSLRDSDAEDRRRITWAFFMLDRTYNASRNYSLCLSDNHFTLPFPLTDSDSQTRSRESLHEKPPVHGQKPDQDILACLLRLYSLWGKATEWVFEPYAVHSLPPWQSGSALSILESEWMQFETQFEDTHRYKNVDFNRRAREDPDSRQYLSTWLCVQFLLHSIQCLLHHPFVTMVKLRDMSGNLSATFLQKSFEASLLHSRWIARFIKEMSEVQLKIYDPFFGYLAAIAATIQIEHTGNKNPKIALLLNNEYRVLIGFIKELSAKWNNMQVLVDRLNELASRHQNYGSLFYNQEGFSGQLSNMATSSNLPRMSAEDEDLMWDIVDLTSLSSSSNPSDFEGPGTRPRDEIQGYSQRGTIRPSSSDMELGPHIRATNAYGLTGIDPIEGETPSATAEETAEWPFASQAHNADIGPGVLVPDIPDWMIFGDLINE
ncbi:hypothetical protein N7456_012724 [Penicillium angulare]|uniref:Xylanolytic transcriptional activator regulatory domain-containing protein n=1 Tax=Penicillium angulare TaxID=116970 RepID=A0A9W9JW43_9EURO|nr:hypothetical protein N7456_012724 [Penicillium angulare]